MNKFTKGKLAFLMGLPRSGKSSIAEQWTRKQIQFNSVRRFVDNECESSFGIDNDLWSLPRVIVCSDDIRIALGHRWNSLAEGFVDATKHTMIRALLQNHDVLVDGTHTTPSHIVRLFEIDSEAEFFFVDTPPGICKTRAEKTGQKDLLPIIDRMSHQLMELVGVDHWDYMVGDAVDASVGPLRMLAWKQTIED